MLKLELPRVAGGHRLLALGAHADDLEIGCGGTILRLAEESSLAEVLWIVLSGDDERRREAEESARAILEGVPTSEIVVKTFRDGFFPYHGWDVKEYFEELKSFRPDVVLTHRRDDLHQDHRLVSELTWNTFRNELVLEYEVPKYDGDLRSPNVFVELSEELCRRKIETLLDSFASQGSRGWFTESVFWGLLRLRGVEAGSATGYAEGFHGRKLVL